MRLELTVPTSLNEIPLGNYQKFKAIADNSTDEDFIAQKMIECFCNIELKEIVKIPYKDMQTLVNMFAKVFEEKTEFKPTFFLKDTKFGFIPDLENISIGELADLNNNINSEENFHKAMAVLYRPIKQESFGKYEIDEYNGTATYSEVMKFAPLDIVLGAIVFFCDLTNDLSNALAIYLERETKKLMNLAKGHNLTNDGVGTLHSINLLRETLPSLMKYPEFQLPQLSRY